MAIYRGVRTTGTGAWVTKDGWTLSPEASRKLWNHSQSFEWGFAGSGPAQLALAILYDHFRNVKGFGPKWTLSTDTIDKVLEGIRRKHGREEKERNGSRSQDHPA